MVPRRVLARRLARDGQVEREPCHGLLQRHNLRTHALAVGFELRLESIQLATPLLNAQAFRPTPCESLGEFLALAHSILREGIEVAARNDSRLCYGFQQYLDPDNTRYA